jgi:hypothetical protein
MAIALASAIFGTWIKPEAVTAFRAMCAGGLMLIGTAAISFKSGHMAAKREESK